MGQREKQKAATKLHILHSAARHLKTVGLTGASVSDVMSTAGLTVGGFYAHFGSKEDLADAVVRHTMTERRLMFLERFKGLEWKTRLRSALREYLTPAHRDDPANGCPLSMAAIEALHTPATASAFKEEFERFSQAFEAGQGVTGASAPREAAIGTLALMIGSMILARAAGQSAASDEILEATDAYGQTALEGFARAQRPPQAKAKR
ncbi:TetR/AcrR family transcriptional regulator [Mesorhizobium koreense]|uniref:TetR/AcrR family transcriptional regulator n=1 Tax=Mesorhizobium koreense TaxID=3074855 RepID=UPI00287B973F|nr:TetR/AcrR family transcriptional regulator [Mesorhizobium sp. WR6]